MNIHIHFYFSKFSFALCLRMWGFFCCYGIMSYVWGMKKEAEKLYKNGNG